jgi:hypothetical protein
MRHPQVDVRPTRTRRMAAALTVSLAVITGQCLAGPAFAGPSTGTNEGPGSSEAPLDAGRYIVLLKDKPLATYTGGVAGIAGTAVPKGKKLDADEANSRRYAAHLKSKQGKVAAAKGVAISRSFTLTVNGFSADLSADQATALAMDSGVFAVVKDTMNKPDYSSMDFLGLPGPDGVWQEQYGGEANAGKGVVVGVLDTGYSPESAFFAGAAVPPLTGAPVMGEPYVTPENQVAMLKADGSTFAGACQDGDFFTGNACNSKVIGARFYDEEFKARTPVELRSPQESYSPRDVNGHGSHTASTAAGNSDVTQVVGGRDFGKGSGVAPAAKIAVYKVCWEGATPEASGCFGSSSVAAIEDSIRDGVDVLNYSISGNNSTTVDPVSIAFLNAAAAGVFVAVSAGNEGPAPSSVNHAAPWVTTVAASTHSNSLRGTVELSTGEKFAGASIMSAEVADAPIANALDLKAAAATDFDAALCVPGSLDPAKTAGKIVVCDRGVIARTAKSAAVAEAGGVGMVLVNLTPSSVDADLHSVPTVHIDTPEIKEVVQANPGLTASLVATDTTDEPLPPVPQLAGFSSLGPTLAVDGDLVKPDVAAPGVAVLAATSPVSSGGETFGFLSGTSMASPHIAGFGALLLGKNPLWSPAAVKSAIMTTAYDLVDTAGEDVQDVFAQGAGHVDPARIASPGLIYDAGIADWLGFLQGLGFDQQVPPIAAKDLNLPSIGLGKLAGTQKVTRTVTALAAGSYTASIDVPGVTASVSPDTLDLKEGEQAAFTVTFHNDGAPLDAFATGFLTWTSDETTVRSPVAVRPVTVIAPASVSATSAGDTGSVEIPVTLGTSQPVDIAVNGLVQAVTSQVSLVPGPANPFPDPSNDVRNVTVPAGSTLARFAVNAADPAADFDLFVLSPTGVLFSSATGLASEAVSIPDPEPGDWTVVTNLFASPGNAASAASVDAAVLAGDAGNLSVTPNPLQLRNGSSGSIVASWTGLAPGNYVALIQYGEGAATELNVTATAAP